MTRFKERLGDLFHEGYIDRPNQQWAFADARYLPAIYESGSGSVRALQALGVGLDDGHTFLAGTAHRQFLHSLMICEVLASLELASRAHSHLRFIGWPEILDRAPETTRSSPTLLRIPVPSGGCLVPDGLFGIEYRVGGTKTYRFFALEADRGTMPIARLKPGQTYLGKIAAYREIMARQVHKSHWGIPNLLMLTLTTSEARMKEMLARLGGLPENHAAFLCRAAPGERQREPMTGLLTEPWQRANHSPLRIYVP